VLFKAQLKSSLHAHFELALAPSLPDVLGNSIQLGQVALNLLQNALHALGSAEGTLRLETGHTAQGCYFAVSDTGSGIRPEHLKHVFEPWFTTKPPGEGTGLGLAIAQRIVTDHGGSIEVHSELGKGSRFTVTLP
jgi:two-component system NtrC family sensor kinase